MRIPLTNSSGNLDESVDPDTMELTKQDVLDFLKIIERRWNKNKIKNVLYIATLEGIIAMTHMTPEGAIKKFWKEIFRFYEFLLTRNAFAKARKGGAEWNEVKKLAKLHMEKDFDSNQ